MSLIYRLPLTNNLNNYGLYNGINYGHNLANQSDGKVGKCYSFGKTTTLAALTDSSGNFITNSQGQIIEVTNSNSSKVNSYIDIEMDVVKQLSSDFSFSLWLRIDGWNTSYETYVYGGVGSSPWANYIFGLLRDSTNSTITFVISNGTTSTTTSCTSGTLTTGNWYHITCTYTSGMMRMYVDGTQVKEYATTIAPDFTKIGAFHLGALNSTTYQTNCSMNDFRLYDHCLSPMEVKELAKGLVLHYPLNRQGWGQENLLLNTQVLTPNSSTSTKNCSQRGSSTRQLRSDGFYEAKCTAAWQGLSTWANAQNLVVGQKYTYSFYFYTNGSTKSLSFYPMMYNSGGTRDTSSTLPISVDGSAYQNGNARAFGTFSNTTPIRHYVTFEWNSTMASIISNGGTIELSIQVHGTFNSGEYGCVYAPKLEIGDKMTPWCPNIADANNMGLNSTIEYDCSGFCNNGTKTGTFTWTSDTPKYAVSQDCIGTNYIHLTPPSTEIQTMAVWVNWKTIPSGQSVILVDNGSGIGLGLYSGGILCSTSGAGSSYAYSKSNLVANTWYHFVVVKTGTTTRKLYINGVEQTATSNSSNWSYSVNQLQLGKRSTTSDGFIGKLSDFRAYATALSADDVKSLYQNSAYIDSSGNVYGAVHSEV